jgi:CRISPR-associated endonuclease/helicase Cas3
MSHAELAPHLARNVLALEARVENGEFASAALSDRLLLDFHHVVCGDIVPQLAGWRRNNPRLGARVAPEAAEIPRLVRDYVLELERRMRALGAAADEPLLETLAYAEGHLLTLHPFTDFNGRTARVWLREILRRLNCPPVALAPSDDAARAEYLAALRAADRAEWRPLMEVWARRFQDVPF